MVQGIRVWFHNTDGHGMLMRHRMGLQAFNLRAYNIEFTDLFPSGSAVWCQSQRLLYLYCVARATALRYLIKRGEIRKAKGVLLVG